MKVWQHIAAIIVLATIIFAFVSPMFVVPATALRAYRIALALIFLLTMGMMTVVAMLIAIPSKCVSIVDALPAEPDPLSQSCELRC